MTDNNVFACVGRTDQALPLRKDPVAILCEWLGRMIKYQAPLGCEDETGFHYEMSPVTNQSSQPLHS